MENKNKKISVPTDADRLIDSIDAQIESNKDKINQALREKKENLLKMVENYERTLDLQEEMLMLKAKDKQAMKDKINRHNAEIGRVSKYMQNLDIQQDK